MRKPNNVTEIASGQPITDWQLGRIRPTPSHVPRGWQLIPLTSVARLESGHTPSRQKPEYWEGNIPWISLHDSKALDCTEIHDTGLTIGPLGLANSSARLLPKGTVVFSRTATVGKVTIMGREKATSQDFANYVCGPNLHNAYLLYVFRYLAPEWSRLMAGSTLNTIYMPVFRELQVFLPPLPEQRAIAAALGDVDALITGLDQLIAKKRDIKQATMQQLLTGKQRLPGFRGEWERKSICDIGEIKTGPFGTLLKAHEYSRSDGVPLISVGEIGDGVFKVGPHTPRVAEEVLRRLPQYVLRCGDIVFGRKGAVDRSALVTMAEDGWFLGSDGISIRLSRDCHPPFVAWQLRLYDTQVWLLQNAIGTTMASLNQEILGRVEISLAPLPEQRAIATVLSDMDAEIAALEKRLEKTRALKQGMMQELLTGRIRLV